MTTGQQAARGLGRLYASTGVSLVGQGAVFAAVPLLASSLTSDPFWVSMVAAAVYAGSLVLGIPVGALVDRSDRRAVMVWSDLVRAALLLVLVLGLWRGDIGVGALVAIVFAISVGSTFFDPAAQAALPSVVGRGEQQLARANGVYWGLDTLGRSLVGPPVGAALFALAHLLPFGLAAVTFSLSAVLLMGLPQLRGSQGAPRGVGDVWSDVLKGLRFVAVSAKLRTLVIGMGVYNFGYNTAYGTFVLFARQRLGVSEVGFGLLLTVPALGGLVGSVLGPRLQGRLTACASYAIFLAIQGVVWLVVALSPSWPAAVPALAVLGFGGSVVTVVAGTERLLLTPNELTGRMLSATRWVGVGGAALGAGASGVVAGQFGLAAPLFAAATLLVVAGALFIGPARRRA